MPFTLKEVSWLLNKAKVGLEGRRIVAPTSPDKSGRRSGLRIIIEEASRRGAGMAGREDDVSPFAKQSN